MMPLPLLVIMMIMMMMMMQEKNWQRMAALGGYYSDAAFLTFLFNSPLLHPQRDTLLTLLHAFMAPHGGAGSRKRTQQCVVPGCELPRLAIRGAQYCLGHQATKYAEGPPPRLEDFMHNMDHAAVFKVTDWVAGWVDGCGQTRHS